MTPRVGEHRRCLPGPPSPSEAVSAPAPAHQLGRRWVCRGKGVRTHATPPPPHSTQAQHPGMAPPAPRGCLFAGRGGAAPREVPAAAASEGCSPPNHPQGLPLLLMAKY